MCPPARARTLVSDGTDAFRMAQDNGRAGYLSAMLAHARQEGERTRIELEQRTSELDGARAELESRLQQLKTLTREGEERAAELVRRRSALAALRAELDGCQAELARAQAELRDRDASAAAAQAQLEGLAARHRQVLASTSWRVTYPLRALRRIFRAGPVAPRSTKGADE